MDRIATEDQVRAEAKEKLDIGTRFCVVVFPPDDTELEPAVYASCTDYELRWMLTFLAKGLFITEAKQEMGDWAIFPPEE